MWRTDKTCRVLGAQNMSCFWGWVCGWGRKDESAFTGAAHGSAREHAFALQRTKASLEERAQLLEEGLLPVMRGVCVCVYGLLLLSAGVIPPPLLNYVNNTFWSLLSGSARFHGSTIVQYCDSAGWSVQNTVSHYNLQHIGSLETCFRARQVA